MSVLGTSHSLSWPAAPLSSAPTEPGLFYVSQALWAPPSRAWLPPPSPPPPLSAGAAALEFVLSAE